MNLCSIAEVAVDRMSGVHCYVPAVCLLCKSRMSGSKRKSSGNASVVKALGYRLEGPGFKPQHPQLATVGLLSKALNPRLLRYKSFIENVSRSI